MTGVVWAVLMVLAAVAVPATAQTAKPPAAQTAKAPAPQTRGPAGDAQAISRGWAAIAAGRPGDAVSVANAVLERRPRSHAAVSLKLEALSATPQPIVALDAYEEWLGKAGRNAEDRGLLEPVAAGLLRVLATDADPVVRSAALRSLARSGDESALQALRRRSTEGDPAAALALARTGDAGGLASVQALVSGGTGRDVSAAVATLAEHGGITPALLEALAKDRVPMNRAAAARALATQGTPEATQQLGELARDPDPFVRSSVTLARASAGDEGALGEARAMLASEVPDLRLMAAEALIRTMPRDAEQAVRPLLTNPDGLVRFRAAALVGTVDPGAVQAVVAEGLAHENPLIRQESARLVTDVLPADIGLLRQLLRSPDRTVVAGAAAAILDH